MNTLHTILIYLLELLLLSRMTIYLQLLKIYPVLVSFINLEGNILKEDEQTIHKFGTSVRMKAIAKLSGHVDQTDYKLLSEADPLTKADAVLVIPATCNTMNKWAKDISDTLVTSL